MRRKALTTALLAGLTGVAGVANIANAVNINPDGTGQALIYPYYTVNDGNQTFVSVVNTTAEGKAVKVRILEGMNSREALDFNLYLSPFDVWTGVFTESSPDGPGAISTGDTSCTVPPIPAGGEPFRNLAYAGAFDDGETDSLRRTREGYVELIEMGVLTDVTEDSLTAATHTGPADGPPVPTDCGQLVDAWRDGGGVGTNYWTANPLVDIAPPTGGLYGGGIVINVPEARAVSYNAVALDRFSALINHTGPGDLLPSLASADPVSVVFDNSAVMGANNGVVETNWVLGRDAVSAVFMHSSVINDYEVNPAIAGATEWVATFPTKRFYVVGPTLPIAPFTSVFDEGGACEDIGLDVYNREESLVTEQGGVDFSPRPPGAIGPQLCWEANVVAAGVPAIAVDMADPDAPRTAVLGSSNAATFDLSDNPGFLSGWARLSFPTQSTNLTENANAEGHIFRGLPVTGFGIQSLVNTALEGGAVVANYDILFDHRYERDICSDIDVNLVDCS